MINEHTSLLAALILFPMITGLMKYSVDFGYRGLDHEEAAHSSRMAALGAVVISLLIGGIHLVRHYYAG